MGKFGADHNFVVVGPRRTGSVMIARALEKITGKPRVQNFTPDEPGIMHIHQPNPSTIIDRALHVLIISRRRDVFLGAISEIVAKRTGEFETYTKNEIDLINNPIRLHVDIDYFDKILNGRRDFYSEIDPIGYAHVVDVYLEDMLQYPYYLFERIGFTQKIATPIETVKSPYRGRDIISNYDELEAYWLKKTSF